jgi:AcrR family transcriptional regulator
MGRPRAATDEEVFAAIAGIVNRHGPAATTLARVGAEAGVTAAALVQRFGSKRAMLLAFATHAAGTVPALFASEDTTQAPLAKLHEALRSLIPRVRSHEQLANHLAFLPLSVIDPERKAMAVQQARAVNQGVKTLLDCAVAAGELTPSDTNLLAEVVLAAWSGALITWAVDGRGRIDSWVVARVDAVIEPHKVRELNFGVEEPDGLVEALSRDSRRARRP